MKTTTRYTLIATICCLTTTIYLQTLAPETWRNIKDSLSSAVPSTVVEKQAAKTTTEVLTSPTPPPQYFRLLQPLRPSRSPFRRT